VVGVAVLVPASDVATLSVSVVSTRWRPDGLGGTWAVLVLDVRWGGLRWTVERAPSAVADMARAVSDRDPATPLGAACRLILPDKAGAARVTQTRADSGAPRPAGLASRLRGLLGLGGRAIGAVSTDIRLDGTPTPGKGGDEDEDEVDDDDAETAVSTTSSLARHAADTAPTPSSAAASAAAKQRVLIQRFLDQLCAHPDAASHPVVLASLGAVADGSHDNVTVGPGDDDDAGWGDEDPTAAAAAAFPRRHAEWAAVAASLLRIGADGVAASQPPSPLLPPLPSPLAAPLFPALPFPVRGLPAPVSGRHVGRHALLGFLGPGDVLLFATTSSAAALQRSATRSDFDHIGLICPPPSAEHFEANGRSPLYMLEVTGDGTGSYPLLRRLEAYTWTGLATRVVARRLVALRRPEGGGRPVPSRLGPEGCRRLSDFCRRATGRPYALTVTKLLSGVAGGTAAAGKQAARAEAEVEAAESPPHLEPVLRLTERQRYFCSEVVAAAWMEAGVMAADRYPAWYWPRHFLAGGAAEGAMLPGYALEGPVEVDATTPEVATLA